MQYQYDLATNEVIETPDEPDDPSKREEFAWVLLREQRNALLTLCDWTVLSDSPTSTAAWKAYRQQLRDLPANTTDPFSPVWPTPPS